MATNLFDPIPDADYGYCLDCDTKFATHEQSREHQDQTLEACTPDANGNRRSHAIRPSNPPRERRIKRHFQEELDSAMTSFYSDVDDLIARGELTEEEAGEALRTTYVDVADGWEDYNND